jgi:YHS domain-containing protein
MWLRTLLLFLLILFLLRAVMRLVRGMAQGMSDGGQPHARRRSQAGASPVKMIADPVCGTYVVPGKALQLARGRETLYFCSEKCRDEWSASR